MKFNKDEQDLKNKLISFEENIKLIYEQGLIKTPIHLSGNNEQNLIKIFRKIKKNDWIISNWRNDYHVLFHDKIEYKDKKINYSMLIF